VTKEQRLRGILAVSAENREATARLITRACCELAERGIEPTIESVFKQLGGLVGRSALSSRKRHAPLVSASRQAFRLERGLPPLPERQARSSERAETIDEAMALLERSRAGERSAIARADALQQKLGALEQRLEQSSAKRAADARRIRQLEEQVSMLRAGVHARLPRHRDKFVGAGDDETVGHAGQ